MLTYLFDWDDTLLSTEIYVNIYDKIVNKLGKNILEKAKNKVYHNGKRFDSGDLCRFFNKEELYLKIILEEARKKDYLFPGVREKIGKLRKSGHKVGIVTNSSRKTVETLLEVYSLKVDFLFTKEDAGVSKKEKLFWQKLSDSFNLNPRECLVQGNDEIEDFSVPLSMGFNAKLIKPGMFQNNF